MIGFARVVSLFAALLVLAGHTTAFAAEASKDEAAIRAINPAWAKAYNAADAKAISGLYAQQAVLLPPGAPAANGNAAINAYFAKDMAESAKAGVTFSLDPKSDVGISGDLAWESGAYAVKAKSGATVERSSATRGTPTLRRRRRHPLKSSARRAGGTHARPCCVPSNKLTRANCRLSGFAQ